MEEKGCRRSTATSSLPSIRATSARPRSKRCSATPAKPRRELGWAPRINFRELVEEMVDGGPEGRRARCPGAQARLRRLQLSRVINREQSSWIKTAASTLPAIAGWSARRSAAICSSAAMTNLLLRTHAELDLTDAAPCEPSSTGDSRNMSFWPRPKSAAFSPTTPIRPTSSATTC